MILGSCQLSTQHRRGNFKIPLPHARRRQSFSGCFHTSSSLFLSLVSSYSPHSRSTIRPRSCPNRSRFRKKDREKVKVNGESEMTLLFSAAALARSSTSRVVPAATAAVAVAGRTSPPTSPPREPPSETRTPQIVPPSRHFGDWRSPLSHRALIRSSAAVTEQFERRFATIGTICFFLLLLCCCFFSI